MHVLNKHQERVPLSHCQRPDNPLLCKADFPRLNEICDETLLLCPGLLKTRDLQGSGRRNKLGCLIGPRNHEYLNGTSAALVCGLPGLGNNSDVQVPYRFPITMQTHKASVCPLECHKVVKIWDVVHAAQRAQNAQAGYACDYLIKRNVRAFFELQEFMKGHRAMSGNLQGRDMRYIAKRHTTRILSDFYGKGVGALQPGVRKFASVHE